MRAVTLWPCTNHQSTESEHLQKAISDTKPHSGYEDPPRASLEKFSTTDTVGMASHGFERVLYTH